MFENEYMSGISLCKVEVGVHRGGPKAEEIRIWKPLPKLMRHQ